MIGQTISHYRITEKLGEGGMGVVYKAEDTKLERTVALKFLAAHLLNDAEAKQRFLREAKAAAALTHPNICTVHEIDEADGKTFLAMEFVEGETLEDRIAKGPLPLKDALDIGRQLADGLEAAHEKGIVHRDIKPANVLLDAKGRATIMDFGLARLTEASRLTKADTTMGTVAYMSPEQAQGLEVDHRTDIWAQGCVLYEMVCGQRPFRGQYDQALFYEIVNQEPEPLTGVRAGVPMELEFIVGKCLAKDASDRYQHANEIAVDLRTLSEKLKSGRSTVVRGASLRAGVPATATAQALPADSVLVPKQKLRVLQGVAALLGVCLLALATVYFTQPPPDAEEKLLRRFSFTAEGLTGGVISPDGRFVAYVAQVEGLASLWLRSLADETSRELARTEGVEGLPFWSPDSRSIGFGVYVPNPELKRISINGGAPIVLCELAAPRGSPFRGGTWSPDGERIVFCIREGLYEVAARGGRPRLLSKTDGRNGPWDPHFVPTNSGPPSVVYAEVYNPLDIRLKAFNLASGEVRELSLGKQPVYSPDGFLIHGPGNSGEGLWALPFSAAALEVTGDGFPISASGSMASLSRDGALLYSDNSGRDMAEKTLVWRNRAGEALETVGQPQTGLREFALSPDRRRVATTADEPSDVWIQDLARSAVTRLTFDGLAFIPTWAPTGKDVVYVVASEGVPNRLMRRAADGTGQPVVLVERGYNSGNADWSRDGRYLVFHGPNGEGTSTDILYVELEGGGSALEPQTFLSTPAAESVPKLSPDGRFVAYVSDESGQFEVYVRSFPSGAGRWQASVNGGKQPRWRDDGTELFYVEADSRLMAVPAAVPAAAAEALRLGQPQFLFESADLMFRGHVWPQYDVSADGQRFLTSTLVDPDVPPALCIVLNWYEQFRDREQD